MVRDVRQKAVDKQMEIAHLQQQFTSNTISKDEFEISYNQLQVELLLAQLDIDIAVTDLMMSPPEFSEMHSTLEELKAEAKLTTCELEDLLSAVEDGNIASREFERRYTRAKSTFDHIDNDLTQIATEIIANTAKGIAIPKGFALISKTRGVIIYKSNVVVDLTEAVKRNISSILSGERMGELQQLPAADEETALNIAYIEVEKVLGVFTDSLREQYQPIEDKQAEINQLKQEHLAGQLSDEEYDMKNSLFQAELLLRRFDFSLAAIEKMIASPGFSDISGALRRLRSEVQPAIDESNSLILSAQQGAIDSAEFKNRYTQLETSCTQLDQLITQAETAKVIQAANKVAVEHSYDLILSSKAVSVYSPTGSPVDIAELIGNVVNATDLVKDAFVLSALP